MYSGMMYTNPATNPYLQALYNTQYGVDMPVAPEPSVSDGFDTVTDSASKMAGFIPYVGPLISAGMNIFSQWFQNKTQEDFYARYMSPTARMAQMKAAGINPNAAAQGIAGSNAPQMNAASPTSAFTGLGEQLGNSANNALTATLLKSQIDKTNAEANLTKSLDIEQMIKNEYADREHAVALDKLVADGEISRSTANMIKVDEYYKGASAYANYQQLLKNLLKTDAEIRELDAKMTYEYAAAYQSMANAALSEAQIHKVFSDIGLNNAQIEKISHEVSNIDAQTAATYQDIDESKARTALIGIQTKFQNDYYGIWESTGFNWNSDVEKSIVGAFANMQTKEADRMLKGLGLYIAKQGDARAAGNDYQTDKVMQMFQTVASLTGMLGVGQGVSGSPVFGSKVPSMPSNKGTKGHLRSNSKLGKPANVYHQDGRRRLFN